MGKLNYVVGDLVKDADNYDVIGHGCNCFCAMGAGIALGVKRKFPSPQAQPGCFCSLGKTGRHPSRQIIDTSHLRLGRRCE